MYPSSPAALATACSMLCGTLVHAALESSCGFINRNPPLMYTPVQCGKLIINVKLRVPNGPTIFSTSALFGVGHRSCNYATVSYRVEREQHRCTVPSINH